MLEKQVSLGLQFSNLLKHRPNFKHENCSIEAKDINHKIKVRCLPEYIMEAELSILLFGGVLFYRI